MAPLRAATPGVGCTVYFQVVFIYFLNYTSLFPSQWISFRWWFSTWFTGVGNSLWQHRNVGVIVEPLVELLCSIWQMPLVISTFLGNPQTAGPFLLITTRYVPRYVRHMGRYRSLSPKLAVSTRWVSFFCWARWEILFSAILCSLYRVEPELDRSLRIRTEGPNCKVREDKPSREPLFYSGMKSRIPQFSTLSIYWSTLQRTQILVWAFEFPLHFPVSHRRILGVAILLSVVATFPRVLRSLRILAISFHVRLRLKTQVGTLTVEVTMGVGRRHQTGEYSVVPSLCVLGKVFPIIPQGNLLF